MPSVDLKTVLMDEEDRIRLSCFRYYSGTAWGKGYLHRKSTVILPDGTRPMFLLHHDIIGKPEKGMMIDHINGDRLDNRRCNLRFVTASQNGQNKKARSSCGFLGVSHDKRRNRYSSVVGLNYVFKNIKTSKNPILCAIAYDDFQLKHRENPRLNFETIRARKKALAAWSDSHEAK